MQERSGIGGTEPDGLRATLNAEAARLGIPVELLLEAFPPAAADTFLTYVRGIPSGMSERTLRRVLGVGDLESDGTANDRTVSSDLMAELQAELSRVVRGDPAPPTGGPLFGVGSSLTPEELLRRMRALPDGAGWAALVRAFGGEGE